MGYPSDLVQEVSGQPRKGHRGSRRLSLYLSTACAFESGLLIDSPLFFQPHHDGSHGTDGCVVWGRRKIPLSFFPEGLRPPQVWQLYKNGLVNSATPHKPFMEPAVVMGTNPFSQAKPGGCWGQAATWSQAPL